MKSKILAGCTALLLTSALGAHAQVLVTDTGSLSGQYASGDILTTFGDIANMDSAVFVIFGVDNGNPTITSAKYGGVNMTIVNDTRMGP